MADPLNELERQVEGGNLFAHSTLTEHASRINEAAAIVNGLVGLLVERGLIEGDELLAAVDSVRERTERAGHHAHVGIAVRVERDVEEPDIDCEARLPICKAACCRLHFALSVEEVERGGPLRWELGHPYFNRHNADGYCHQWDGGCKIYDDRPNPCRMYSCEHDDRIWKDFEGMVINQEWIDAHLGAERSPIEIFMETAENG